MNVAIIAKISLILSNLISIIIRVCQKIFFLQSTIIMMHKHQRQQLLCSIYYQLIPIASQRKCIIQTICILTLLRVIVPTHYLFSTHTVTLIQCWYRIFTAIKAFSTVQVSKITDYKLPLQLYTKNTLINLSLSNKLYIILYKPYMTAYTGFSTLKRIMQVAGYQQNTSPFIKKNKLE